MNIILLSQFFSTTKGGGEYVFKTIANSLVENDHNVWVITNKIKNSNFDHYVSDCPMAGHQIASGLDGGGDGDMKPESPFGLLKQAYGIK